MNPSNRQIRIGTRGSRLALWQAEHVASRLRELGAEVSIEVIQTAGDLDKVTDFGALGAKGIFVKEIEAALLEGRIDLAVHSLKDLPTALPDGLVLGAALERASPFDALVSRDRLTLDRLPTGATVATGSLRRAAQILRLRPDLKIGAMRGNVPTRVQKIRDGQADATLLAEAGLRRLGFEAEMAQVFSPEEVTPSMGQGALALETRRGELAEALGAALAEVEDPATRACVDAERAFLEKIEGGCKTPVGVLAAKGEGSAWKITAMMASPDASSFMRRSRDVPTRDGLTSAALELAGEMLSDADDAILATLGDTAARRGSEAGS